MNNPYALKTLNGGSLDREMLEQLAHNEKMAELGQLATGLVHELNTPLSVINSASQMILREGDLSEFVREMVERIDAETHRLAQFTRGLLSFTRREEGEIAETSLVQALQEVMAFLRYEAQKRSVQMVEDLDYRLSPVVADGNHLKQVFINLIMNAIQAMPEGGTLMIRAHVTREGEVTTEIADTGPGIPEDAMKRIFEPFFTTKKAGEGTGLGLFITRKIVELYGGRIEVISRPGEGTTFVVTLPAAEEPEFPT